MHCTVLLFAQLAEDLGKNQVTLEVADGATLADALAALADEHEAIATMRSTLAMAVNEQYCASTTVLKDGDTVALIPPVSGG